MSRYTLLILINIPFIAAGILNALVSYKLNHTDKRRFVFRIGLWVTIFTSLVLAEPLYNFLFSNNLTRTEPLSLFDVMQITGIILTFFIVNQAYSKVHYLEGRLQDLNQRLSIVLSNNKERTK